MLLLDLPVLQGSARIHRAMKEMIEAERSGLLFWNEAGDLHIVSYDQVIAADGQGVQYLKEVTAEQVVSLHALADEAVEDTVKRGGARFSFVRDDDGSMLAYSLQESLGTAFFARPPGRRCDRPGKKATVDARDWYHYYPPNTRDPNNRNQCKYCCGKIP
jgi:hypothetical protein